MSTSEPPTVPAGDVPDITLYWLNQSRAQRIIWLLEELKLPYKLEIFKRVNKLAPAAGKKIHPLGKFPMLSLNGEVLAESALIIDVMAERYGPQLLPPKEEEIRYRYFMHYAEGSFMTPLVIGVVMNALGSAPMPFFIKPIARMIASKVEESFVFPNYVTHLDFLEGELEGRTFFVGEKLTGADILLSYPLTAMKGKVKQFSAEAYPKLWAYTERLEAMDGFKKAEAKTADMETETL
ncbi:glutathione S-transferase-like protein [Geopyxis carbonaria]|nr:glutathione S-transferase-like protein [Geopyxis carbonaria]